MDINRENILPFKIFFIKTIWQEKFKLAWEHPSIVDSSLFKSLSPEMELNFYIGINKNTSLKIFFPKLFGKKN